MDRFYHYTDDLEVTMSETILYPCLFSGVVSFSENSELEWNRWRILFKKSPWFSQLVRAEYLRKKFIPSTEGSGRLPGKKTIVINQDGKEFSQEELRKVKIFKHPMLAEEREWGSLKEIVFSSLDILEIKNVYAKTSGK